MTFLVNCYNRLDISIDRGEGVHLFDTNGKQYLDFAAGIATNSLGHCSPVVTKAINEQSQKLIHSANLFNLPLQQNFAQSLCNSTFADKAFFCSSGLEAVEAAVKFMRLWGYKNKNGANRIISFNGGFHGRSMVGISAGGGEKAKQGFAPLLGGFDAAIKNDIESVKKQITPQTCGILLEPIQAEGGIYSFSSSFMKKLKQLCVQENILLCFDEVQCGYGRTGKLYDYMNFKEGSNYIEPDLLTSAKGIGSGFPLAAVLLNNKVADCITKGSHGSTYGGNALGMAVGQAVFNKVNQPAFLDNVKLMGEYLRSCLQELKQTKSSIIDIRGRGLLIGVELEQAVNPREVMQQCAQKGLIITTASGSNVLRLVPPLIIEKQHIDEALAIIASSI